MLLSDRDLRKEVESGRLVLDPFDDVMVQPSSIDVRLDRFFRVFNNTRYTHIDPSMQQDDLTSLVEPADGEPFVLHPGEFALGSTIERVRIPSDLVARVEGRSSFGRLAVVVHATAGFIDPGFEGQITLELSNLGRCAVLLYPGTRISQIVLHTMTSPAERPYGPARGSKYHGQMGPVMSRVNKDR